VYVDQLRHLRQLAEFPGFTLRVLPLGRTAHAALDGPFVLLETPEHQRLAHTENQRGSRLIADPDEVAILTQKWRTRGNCRTVSWETNGQHRTSRALLNGVASTSSVHAARHHTPGANPYRVCGLSSAATRLTRHPRVKEVQRTRRGVVITPTPKTRAARQAMHD